jgi:hypothetical protein
MRFRVPELFLGAFLAVAIFSMGMMIASSRFQPSRAEQQDTSGQHADKKTDQSRETKSLWIPEDATGFFTLWIAAFTGILAISTIFLWRSTRDAAVAGRVAAEHIPRVERAYLFVTVKAENFGVILTEYTKMTDDNLKERSGSNLVVDFSIENEGKTPAVIRSVSAQMLHYKGLPDEPGYGAPLDLPKNRFLGAGKEIKPSIMVDMLAPTYGTVGMLMRAESAIWFYGRVTYDDIFGDGHEHCFCWRYSSGYFLPYYRNEKYIKNT